MNITQLEKVIKKLRYYKVDKEIDDLPNYLKNLTPKELENIISMDFDERSIEISRITWLNIFNNHKLLSSDIFYESLNLIFNELPIILNSFPISMKNEIKASEEFCGLSLFEISTNEDAIQGGFLLTDMKLIIDKISKFSDTLRDPQYGIIDYLREKYIHIAKTLIKIMCQIATNEVSLKGRTHSKVMETLFDMELNDKDLDTAECLKKVECFEPANNFSYHSKGLNLIMTSKTNVIAKVLTKVQLSKIVYENPEDFLINDLELIHDSKTDVIADCLGVVATSAVSIKDLSLKRLIHNTDMKKISLSSTKVIAQCLSDVAIDESSIKSGNHSKHVDIIFNSDSDEEALSYARVILNCKYADDLDKIRFNARLFIDDQSDKSIELPDSVFKITQKNSS